MLADAKDYEGALDAMRSSRGRGASTAAPAAGDA